MLFNTLAGLYGFVDVVISAQIIPLLPEVYTGDPFTTSFIQIDPCMPGGCTAGVGLIGNDGADTGSFYQILAVRGAILPAFLIPTAAAMDTFGMKAVHRHFGGIAALAVKFPYDRATVVPFICGSDSGESVKGFTGDVLFPQIGDVCHCLAATASDIAKLDICHRHILFCAAIAPEFPDSLPFSRASGFISHKLHRLQSVPSVSLFDSIVPYIFHQATTAAGMLISQVRCRDDFLAPARTFTAPKCTSLGFPNDFFGCQ